MENIFQGSKFGDKFLTKDGKVAIYNCMDKDQSYLDGHIIKAYHALMVENDYIFQWYTDSGFNLNGNPNLDIIFKMECHKDSELQNFDNNTILQNNVKDPETNNIQKPILVTTVTKSNGEKAYINIFDIIYMHQADGIYVNQNSNEEYQYHKYHTLIHCKNHDYYAQETLEELEKLFKMKNS